MSHIALSSDVYELGFGKDGTKPQLIELTEGQVAAVSGGLRLDNDNNLRVEDQRSAGGYAGSWFGRYYGSMLHFAYY